MASAPWHIATERSNSYLKLVLQVKLLLRGDVNIS
jgi:hypothetical protein